MNSKINLRKGRLLILLAAPSCLGACEDPIEVSYCDPSQEVDFSVLGDWRGKWLSDDGQVVVEFGPNNRPRKLAAREDLENEELHELKRPIGVDYGCKHWAKPLVEGGHNTYELMAFTMKRNTLTKVRRGEQSIELNFVHLPSVYSPQSNVSHTFYRFTRTSDGSLHLVIYSGDTPEHQDSGTSYTFKERYE